MSRIAALAFSFSIVIILSTIASAPKHVPMYAAPADVTGITSSIGTMVPAWIRRDVRSMTVAGKTYSVPAYVFIEALAGGPCAVQAQIGDLVTDVQHQCFDAASFRFDGVLIVPVPADPERVVKIGDGDRWWRVSQLREKGRKRRGARS